MFVADIVNSTQAIEAGRFRDINTLGGGTIAAVLNAVRPHRVPYVFGGDGATFCVAADQVAAVSDALRGCQDMAREGFDLVLRVGCISVAALSKPVRATRFQKAPHLIQYFFIGNGLSEAEARIKRDPACALPPGRAEADFSGFECRWNEIPSKKQRTLSLLVQAMGATRAERLATYSALHTKIEHWLGDETGRHPLNLSGLSLSANPDKLRGEATLKTGFSLSSWRRRLSQWHRMAVLWLQNRVGNVWMRRGMQALGAEWGRYKADLITHTDFFKLDDIYRTVVSADDEDWEALHRWLQSQQAQGTLCFGVHVTDAAMVTCLVEKTGVEHLHFVDSIDGGYAVAARQLKQQLQRDQKDT
ncbi:hypothetical protein AVO41_00425 [Thiomicrospira sp. WB1]|nr:hypothetical protein AVO41_00425 [Thiomicrospira sp. WB1]